MRQLAMLSAGLLLGGCEPAGPEVFAGATYTLASVNGVVLPATGNVRPTGDLIEQPVRYHSGTLDVREDGSCEMVVVASDAWCADDCPTYVITLSGEWEPDGGGGALSGDGWTGRASHDAASAIHAEADSLAFSYFEE